MRFKQGYALLVGVSTYEDAPELSIPQLRQDVQEVAASLRTPRFCGDSPDHVVLLTDAEATRDRVLAALRQITSVIDKDGLFFLFYSGHGCFGEDSYYLTTYDTQFVAKQVMAGTGLRERELLASMQAIPSQRALLVFNTCHAGVRASSILSAPPSVQVESPTGSNLPNTLAYALVGTGKDRAIITACGEQQQAPFVRNEPITPFARALADGLQGCGITSHQESIRLFDLYDHIHTTVSNTAWQRWHQRQVPELTITKGSGILAMNIEADSTAVGVLPLVAQLQASGTAIREVDSTEGIQTFQQLLTGQINLTAEPIRLANVPNAGDELGSDRNEQCTVVGFGASNKIGDVTVGDVAGRNIFKENVFDHHIATNGGDYAGGNIDKRQGIFGGGIFYGPVVGVQYGEGAIPPVPNCLHTALNQVRAAAERAQNQGQTTLAEDLMSVASTLEAALKAERTGDQIRRQTKRNRALADMDSIIQQQPTLCYLAQLLAQT